VLLMALFKLTLVTWKMAPKLPKSLEFLGDFRVEQRAFGPKMSKESGLLQKTIGSISQ
jgi:hypothetical protein